MRYRLTLNTADQNVHNLLEKCAHMHALSTTRKHWRADKRNSSRIWLRGKFHHTHLLVADCNIPVPFHLPYSACISAVDDLKDFDSTALCGQQTIAQVSLQRHVCSWQSDSQHQRHISLIRLYHQNSLQQLKPRLQLVSMIHNLEHSDASDSCVAQ